MKKKLYWSVWVVCYSSTVKELLLILTVSLSSYMSWAKCPLLLLVCCKMAPGNSLLFCELYSFG